jgi:hypothetical protein
MATLSTSAVDLSVLDEVVRLPEGDVSGGVLAGRKGGEAERTRLMQALKSYGPGSVLGVNLRAAHFMNFSFADECFGVLMQELYAGEAKDRYMVLIVSPDEQEDILEEIQVSLERKKLAMFYADIAEGLGELRIVGELPDYLVHTLESIRPGDTNETLAERLDIKLTTCSNRTDRLARLRLLRKQRRHGDLGYKQFEFFPVLPTAGSEGPKTE